MEGSQVLTSASGFRIFSSVLIFSLGIVGGLLPHVLASNVRLTSFLNVCAGGIFFSGALVCNSVLLWFSNVQSINAFTSNANAIGRI
jgi:hypothetical protein